MQLRGGCRWAEAHQKRSTCRIVQVLQRRGGGSIVIELPDAFIVDCQEGGGFGETKQTFVPQVGQYLSDTHGSEKISASLNAIFNDAPTFAFVHEPVMKDCEAKGWLLVAILAPNSAPCSSKSSTSKGAM